MSRWLTALLLTVGSMPAVYADGQSRAMWTAVGAGGGFGVGVWAGLSAFDDAIDAPSAVRRRPAADRPPSHGAAGLVGPPA